MKYLIFTNTPAHVHLYRNTVTELQRRGHDVLVLARDYGCTVDLLDWYDISYELYGRCDTSKISLFRQLPHHYASIFKQTRAFDPDLIFGMGGYAAHAGLVSRTPTILILDSEPTSLDHLVSKPFAEMILTPFAFQKDLGEKHYTFDGFKETAYLCPENYSPDPSVRDDLGIGDEPFTILRFNAFGSHHDVHQGGFTRSELAQLIEHLAQRSTVFVSDESGTIDLSDLPAREFDIHPGRMHDAIYEASLLVADTQTIVTEAALLGTPVIRSNSFVGENDMGNFLELEEKGLVQNLSSFDDVLSEAERLLSDPEIADEWRRRRDSYLKGKVDLTDIIVDIATVRGTEDIARATDEIARPGNP